MKKDCFNYDFFTVTCVSFPGNVHIEGQMIAKAEPAKDIVVFGIN